MSKSLINWDYIKNSRNKSTISNKNGISKVISYFNPDKYHEHWVRVQNQNPDWHHPIAWVQRRLGPALVKQIRQHFNNNNEDLQHQQQQYNPRWNYNNPQYNQTNQQYHHNHRTNNTSNNNQRRESVQPNQYREHFNNNYYNIDTQQQQYNPRWNYNNPHYNQNYHRINNTSKNNQHSMYYQPW